MNSEFIAGNIVIGKLPCRLSDTRLHRRKGKCLAEPYRQPHNDGGKCQVKSQLSQAQEAIEAIQKLKPNAVILDIKMPGGSGIGVLEDIKKNNTNIKVIMFTNYPYPQYRKKCMGLGADYFFDKSKEQEKVVEVLKGLWGC